MILKTLSSQSWVLHLKFNILISLNTCIFRYLCINFTSCSRHILYFIKVNLDNLSMMSLLRRFSNFHSGLIIDVDIDSLIPYWSY